MCADYDGVFINRIFVDMDAEMAPRGDAGFVHSPFYAPGAGGGLYDEWGR